MMRVAFGKTVLTPPEFLGGIVGRPMAGYTPVTRIKEKYDDIQAHAILIETTILGNIKKYLLLISMDVLLVPLLLSEYIKEKIQDNFNIHPNQVLIHGTHTHKSVDIQGTFSRGGLWFGVVKSIIVGSGKADDKYKIWMARQIVRMVDDMITRLQPAKFAWKKIIPEEPLTVNRRKGGISNQPLSVLAFKQQKTGELLGILMSMGAHPTTIASRTPRLSAEWPGRAMNIVEQDTEGKVQAIFFNGPCGDISAYYGAGGFRHIRKNANGQLRRKGLYTFTKHYGNLIGRKALKMAQEIPDNAYHEELRINSYMRTFWVPMKDYKRHWVGGGFNKTLIRFNNRAVFIIKKHLLIPLALIMSDAHEPNFPGIALKFNRQKNKLWTDINVYTQVQYITIDAFKNALEPTPSATLALVGVPGEPFEDVAKRIYDMTPTKFENTIIFENSNDWISYFFLLRDYVIHHDYIQLESFFPLAGFHVMWNYKLLLEEIKERIIAGFY